MTQARSIGLPPLPSIASDFETFVRPRPFPCGTNTERRLAMRKTEKPVAGGSTLEPVAISVNEDAIRKRAHELYEQRGWLDGHAVDDWLAAKAELQLKSK